MSDEKRLSVTFGDFSCEIVGYDDPFSILNKIVSLLATMKDVEWRGENAPRRDRRAVFAEKLKTEAEAAGLAVSESEGRFIVSSAENDAVADDDAEATLTISPAVFTAASDRAPARTGATAEIAPETRDDLEADQTAEVAEPAEDAAEDEADDAAAAVLTLVADEVPAGTPAAVVDETAVSADAGETPLDDIVEDEIAAVTGTLRLEPLTLVAPMGPASRVSPEDIGVETEAEDSDDAATLFESRDAAPAAPLLEPARFLDVISGAGPDAAETASDDLTQRKPSSVLDLDATLRIEYPEPETAEADEAPDAAASPAEPEAATVEPAAPARPRIVIDRARSRSHTQQRQERKAPRVTIEQRRVEPTEADAAAKAVAPEETPEAPLSLTPAELRQPKAAPADADTNFLFDEVDAFEEPLTLTAPEPQPMREAVSAPPAKKERTSRRLPLGLGIFGRKRNAEAAEDVHSDDEFAGFARLEEAAHTALPKLDQPTRSLSEGAAAKLFALSDADDFADDEASPAGFARRVGARSLQDLLEASAAYVAIVEGKAKFSRRDVMTALSEIEMEKNYTSEARIKTFRKLVSSGALVRDDSGLFSISHATRFGYENQLRA